jgi:hypothetical protein
VRQEQVAGTGGRHKLDALAGKAFLKKPPLWYSKRTPPW